MDRSTCPCHRSQISVDLSIVMDPQPFPRRFLGNIRSMTRITCNQGTRIENVVAARFEILPNTRFTSRDTTAIDITSLVTDLVTVNDNMRSEVVNLRDLTFSSVDDFLCATVFSSCPAEPNV